MNRTLDLSDGSDIEVDSDADDVNLLGTNLEDVDRDRNNNETLNDDIWLRFFDDDQDYQDDFEGFQNDWVTEMFSPRLPNGYTKRGGPAELHPEEARPAHYFDLLWGQDFWDILVEETNRYADQQRAENPPSRFAPKWTPVDKPTMKAFVGLTFVMGILRLPARNDFWRTSKRMFTTSFNSIMPRDRFNLIWHYLHLTDNQQPQETPDKLRKIRPMMTYLNDKFMNAYTPYGNVTVDESMVKFKGRLGFRQYLPSKPIKWGIKLWALAESTTGYLHRFQIYTGREEGVQGKGLSHRVVHELTNHLRFSNVRVFMDNFYSSPDLFTSLLNVGIYACGTVRSNRKGLPPQLLPKIVKLPKHEFKVAQKDDVMACCWQDTKPVMVLSSFHDPDAVGTVNRRSGNSQQQRVRVPKAIEDYQRHMKGVDLFDQMVGYYMPNHRSRKWWRRLFHHMQMSAAHNAYIIARDSNPEVIQREWPQFQDFVEDLAEDLIGNYKASRAAPLTNIENLPPVPREQHEIKSKLFEKKKSCMECRSRAAVGVRVRATQSGCSTCNQCSKFAVAR
ncbi:piggyBac transposable element-derived protein 4-like [Mya arenaria]|uniref:piggyBac transposable element-derived protein 4-like n=1 Tax=Mya arenaria TaxID=6604 RepID=UPI0022E9271D|nr:piggyBac transposable element-derived protein 4-like [Mya arenaria]